ncbi:MAG: SET domain-containing protein-lysine N-methyltransferase [Synechococcaceae cyanobacterium SM2_3_2]|nr:SET domain-containing protein-lysine N-methyltransferase [Synechococcaceae cyanobacterium SM2_3_2]
MFLEAIASSSTPLTSPVLVAGSSSILGSQLCLQLVLRGQAVIAVDQDSPGLLKLAQELRNVRGSFQCFWLTESPSSQSLGWPQLPTLAGLLDVWSSLDLTEIMPQGFSGIPAVAVRDPSAQRKMLDEAESSHHKIWVSQQSIELSQSQPAPFTIPARWVADCALSLLDGDTIAEEVEIQADAAGSLWQTQPDYPAKRLGAVAYVSAQQGRFGRGLVASRDFQRGDLVVQTHGHVLSYQTEHSMQVDWEHHYEPFPPARFINHRCEPNLGVKTNPQGLPDFYALHSIKVGEELYFDYAMTEFEHIPRDDAALEFNLACHCDSPQCRKKLGYYSDLTSDIKQIYTGFLSRYLIDYEKAKITKSAFALE